MVGARSVVEDGGSVCRRWWGVGRLPMVVGEIAGGRSVAECVGRWVVEGGVSVVGCGWGVGGLSRTGDRSVMEGGYL